MVGGEDDDPGAIGHAGTELCRSMARKKAAARRRKTTMDKQALLGIERGAKRAEQKAQGALDGRFRQRKVESKKAYSRKTRRRTDDA